MAKSQRNQTFVLKLNTGYLAKYHWDVTIKLNDARKDPKLIVSLGSSQVLRWLEEIQGKESNDFISTNIKKTIKRMKQDGASLSEIANKYNQLYATQFQQDYMMLVMDSVKDYKYVCKHGYKITIDYGGGVVKTVKYKRFLGTAGSIKKAQSCLLMRKCTMN